LVHQQATLPAQATQWFRWLMPSFQLSFVRDVLPATRPGLAIERVKNLLVMGASVTKPLDCSQRISKAADLRREKTAKPLRLASHNAGELRCLDPTPGA